MKISDYAKAQGWLKRHASSENSAGEWEKYVALNTTPELDIAIRTINDKYGPGTMFPASEAPIPPMTDQQAIFEFGQRNPKAEGGPAKQLLAQPNADGSRPGYATSTVKKGKFIYPVTNQSGTVYSDKKPKSSAAEIGSGKFSIADRNRITRIKYPEYTSYLELLKKEPAKAKNVMASLQYSSVSGSKIKKKTHLTRLTKIQENKILVEFPDAVFFDGQKFGFNTKTDQTKFVQVKKFIERGYKPRFKQLPDKVKNQLKEKFSEFKDWDFKKFKYGVPDTLNNVENRKLMMKVKNFINDPKPYMFGFSLDKPGAWMTQQMYRAWEHGNTDYEPKYNKNGKVVGMYEKGKLYYANKNVADIDGAKKAKLINSHPEFNNVQKFVDVANEAKLPLKDLTGYKNTKSLLALFPEGYESVKFSDLTNYLYRNAGADVTRNAIEKHHLKNLSDMGAPIDSKNLQLLRQDLNTLGNTITEQIKKGDFSRVADLEKAGVKITVDGKTYGKGFQDPRRQMNRIIGDVTEKVSSLNKKEMNNLINQLTGGDPKLNKFVMNNVVSSGPAGAYEMLSNDLKRFVNTPEFKTFSKYAAPAIKYGKLPAKLYGWGDFVLGGLDFANNKSKGMDNERAAKEAFDMMLFGATEFGEKELDNRIKATAKKYGINEDRYERLKRMNKNQKEVQKLVEDFAAQAKQSKELMESGMGSESIEHPLLEKKKKAGQQKLKDLMAQTIKDQGTLATNLRIEKVGGPIQAAFDPKAVDVSKEQGEAFKSLSNAAYEVINKELTAPGVIEQQAQQLNPTWGKEYEDFIMGASPHQQMAYDWGRERMPRKSVYVEETDTKPGFWKSEGLPPSPLKMRHLLNQFQKEDQKLGEYYNVSRGLLTGNERANIAALTEADYYYPEYNLGIMQALKNLKEE